MVENVNDSSEEEMPSEASMDIEEDSSDGREADFEDEEQDHGYATYNEGDSDKLDNDNDDMWTLRERIWKYRTLMCWVLRMEKEQAMS